MSMIINYIITAELIYLLQMGQRNKACRDI
jgi:hypothetical protein